MFRYALFLISISFLSCSSSADDSNETDAIQDTTSIAVDSTDSEQPDYCNEQIRVGAAQFELYEQLVKGKRVGLVGNQSSMVDGIHLVDTLISRGINIVKVFSPEHGFRGKADAGEMVDSDVDEKTGLPIVSLYRKNKAPTKEELQDVDILLFDIQDVGARFYTYISTMSYVMEAVAANGKEMIILDRPNPNGHYVAGPLLDPKYKSFVGMHPVPVVHGMTIGEYAKMVDGEKWMSAQLNDKLTVIPIKDWDHTMFYELPIAPSPNLPNMRSIYLYPTLCLFEGTIVSIGRGTDIPFQCVGHPEFEVDVLEDLYSFTPAPNEGSKHPKLEGETCHGYSFENLDLDELRNFGFSLKYLAEFHLKLKGREDFFLKSGFINNLLGYGELKGQIEAGMTHESIEAEWQANLEEFKAIRAKYLLYQDFE